MLIQYKVVVSILMATCQVSPGDRIKRLLSDLAPMPSRLASTCYIFQGFPKTVFGTSFMYGSEVDRAHENYLTKLFESPKSDQRALAEVAAFVSSRVYVNQQGEPFLLLVRQDSLNYLTLLEKHRTLKMSWRDELLNDCLRTYLNLGLDAQHRGSGPRFETMQQAGSVMANVRALSAKFSVGSYIHSDWSAPFPIR